MTVPVVGNAVEMLVGVERRAGLLCAVGVQTPMFRDWEKYDLDRNGVIDIKDATKLLKAAVYGFTYGTLK